MDRTNRKALARTAAVCGLTAAAASYATTRYLVKIALDREEPRLLKQASQKIAGSKKIDQTFIQQLQEASERLENAENEPVTITAHDGEALLGHWFASRQPKRIVIAMHGWRASWHKDFGTVMDFWRRTDCSVLLPEQRGQNGSGGECIGFGVTERYDVLDWVQWVTERCGSGIPIYLCGVSMGASTVLMASGLPLPSNVHGIIADCGYTSPSAIWKHIANDNLHITYGIRSIFADSLFRKKNMVGLADCSTVDALRETNIPVLFVHGTQDHFVPVEMTYENYAACASDKRLLIVPGADHGMSYYLDPVGYEKAVKDFWRDFD